MTTIYAATNKTRTKSGMIQEPQHQGPQNPLKGNETRMIALKSPSGPASKQASKHDPLSQRIRVGFAMHERESFVS